MSTKRVRGGARSGEPARKKQKTTTTTTHSSDDDAAPITRRATVATATVATTASHLSADDKADLRALSEAAAPNFDSYYTTYSREYKTNIAAIAYNLLVGILSSLVSSALPPIYYNDDGTVATDVPVEQMLKAIHNSAPGLSTIIAICERRNFNPYTPTQTVIDLLLKLDPSFDFDLGLDPTPFFMRAKHFVETDMKTLLSLFCKDSAYKKSGSTADLKRFFVALVASIPEVFTRDVAEDVYKILEPTVIEPISPGTPNEQDTTAATAAAAVQEQQNAAAAAAAATAAAAAAEQQRQEEAAAAAAATAAAAAAAAEQQRQEEEMHQQLQQALQQQQQLILQESQPTLSVDGLSLPPIQLQSSEEEQAHLLQEHQQTSDISIAALQELAAVASAAEPAPTPQVDFEINTENKISVWSANGVVRVYYRKSLMMATKISDITDVITMINALQFAGLDVDSRVRLILQTLSQNAPRFGRVLSTLAIICQLLVNDVVWSGTPPSMSFPIFGQFAACVLSAALGVPSNEIVLFFGYLRTVAITVGPFASDLRSAAFDLSSNNPDKFVSVTPWVICPWATASLLAALAVAEVGSVLSGSTHASPTFDFVNVLALLEVDSSMLDHPDDNNTTLLIHLMTDLLLRIGVAPSVLMWLFRLPPMPTLDIVCQLSSGDPLAVLEHISVTSFEEWQSGTSAVASRLASLALLVVSRKAYRKSPSPNICAAYSALGPDSDHAAFTQDAFFGSVMTGRVPTESPALNPFVSAINYRDIKEFSVLLPAFTGNKAGFLVKSWKTSARSAAAAAVNNDDDDDDDDDARSVRSSATAMTSRTAKSSRSYRGARPAHDPDFEPGRAAGKSRKKKPSQPRSAGRRVSVDEEEMDSAAAQPTASAAPAGVDPIIASMLQQMQQMQAALERMDREKRK